MHNVTVTTILFLLGGERRKKSRGKKRDREVPGKPTCERPGEGAGWGAEGDPVIGCGALFISRGSACGGRRGPAQAERKHKRSHTPVNHTISVQISIRETVAMICNIMTSVFKHSQSDYFFKS